MPLTKLDTTAALIVIDLQKGIVGIPTVHPAQYIIVMVGEFRARNHVVFSTNDEETFISNNPSLVALASKSGKTAELRRECWSNKELKDLTVSLGTGRGYLRTGNSSRPNHPKIRLLMNIDQRAQMEKEANRDTKEGSGNAAVARQAGPAPARPTEGLLNTNVQDFLVLEKPIPTPYTK